MADDSDLYVGANGGQSRADIDNGRIVDGLAEVGIASTANRDHERHFVYKFLGGFKFDKYIALEAAYFDLGQFGYPATTEPAAALTGRIKLNCAKLDAIGELPSTEKFTVIDLSSRRLAELETYKVEALGIFENKMSVRRADGSEPVKKGRRRTTEPIACLQPDRRVEVAVTGMQPEGWYQP